MAIIAIPFECRALSESKTNLVKLLRVEHEVRLY